MKFEELPQKKQSELIKAWSHLVNQVTSNAARKYSYMDRDELKHFATIGLWNSFQNIDLKQIINLDNNSEFEDKPLTENDWNILISGSDGQHGKFATFARMRMSGFIVDQLRLNLDQRRGFNKEYDDIFSAKQQLIISGISRPTYAQIGEVLGKTSDELIKIVNEKIKHVSNDYEESDSDESLSVYDGLVDEQDTPDVFLHKIQSIKNLSKAINLLNDREKYIFEGYYFKDLKLKDMGEELGVNESRVSQLLKAALTKVESYVRRYQESDSLKSSGMEMQDMLLNLDIKKNEEKKESFYITYTARKNNDNKPEWERIKMEKEQINENGDNLDIYKIHPGDIYTLSELVDEIAQRKYIFFNAKFVLSLYTHVDKLSENLSYSDFAFLAQNPQVWGMTKHVDVLDDFKIPKEDQERFLKKFKADVLDNNFTLTAAQKDAFLSGVFSNFKSVENTKEFNDSFNDIFKDFIHNKIGYSTMTPLMFMTAWSLADADRKDFMQVSISTEQRKEISKFPTMFMKQLFPGIEEELKNRGMWIEPEQKLKTGKKAGMKV